MEGDSADGAVSASGSCATVGTSLWRPSRRIAGDASSRRTRSSSFPRRSSLARSHTRFSRPCRSLPGRGPEHMMSKTNKSFTKQEMSGKSAYLRRKWGEYQKYKVALAVRPEGQETTSSSEYKQMELNEPFTRQLLQKSSKAHSFSVEQLEFEQQMMRDQLKLEKLKEFWVNIREEERIMNIDLAALKETPRAYYMLLQQDILQKQMNK